MWAKYRAVCTYSGCGKGQRVFDEAESRGLQQGYIIPYSPGDPEYGKCPLCHRYEMKVVDVPFKPLPPGPEGWTKVPTE